MEAKWKYTLQFHTRFLPDREVRLKKCLLGFTALPQGKAGPGGCKVTHFLIHRGLQPCLVGRCAKGFFFPLPEPFPVNTIQVTQHPGSSG